MLLRRSQSSQLAASYNFLTIVFKKNECNHREDNRRQEKFNVASKRKLRFVASMARNCMVDPTLLVRASTV
jgi:hypothetical protein